MGITVERTMMVDCDSPLFESLLLLLLLLLLLSGLEELKTQVPALRLKPLKQVRHVKSELEQVSQTIGQGVVKQFVLVLPAGLYYPFGQRAHIKPFK